jgi:hypothetical protein
VGLGSDVWVSKGISKNVMRIPPVSYGGPAPTSVLKIVSIKGSTVAIAYSDPMDATSSDSAFMAQCVKVSVTTDSPHFFVNGLSCYNEGGPTYCGSVGYQGVIKLADLMTNYATNINDVLGINCYWRNSSTSPSDG